MRMTNIVQTSKSKKQVNEQFHKWELWNQVYNIIIIFHCIYKGQWHPCWYTQWVYHKFFYTQKLDELDL
jgi:hypothetical protein